MPRQNRVTPLGDIVAVPERGTMLGNRGVLHDDEGRIRRAWQLKRWIVCVLEFRGRKRAVMTPGRYTELFFLDEATALAAGHRPCAECRRQRFLDYCAAWKTGNPRIVGRRKLRAPLIDERLHAERIGPLRTFTAKLDNLPDGVFVQCDRWGNGAYLLWQGRLLAWSPGGYVEVRSHPGRAEVRVLTPISTVAAMRAGYIPDVHSSAESL